MSRLLGCAGLSARQLVEAARDGAFRAVALDLFGDMDTRRAAEAWRPIGDAKGLAVGRQALLDALRDLRAAGAFGWVAGSGLEGDTALLAEGARTLPLIGNPAETVAAVRDPGRFFGRLAALGIPHPETRLDPPQDPTGWLRKHGGGSGGREVWPAGRAESGAGVYYQRLASGSPMSALFLADGTHACMLGVNAQIVRPRGRRPFVFHGCIGPLPVAPALYAALQGIAEVLSAEFGLRGLNGLDFLLDGDRLSVLELNPRPPASIGLYRDALPGGLMAAHVAASEGCGLPDARQPGVRPDLAPMMIQGFELVFADTDIRIGAAAADALMRRAWCHDLPPCATEIARGSPVCTVSAACGSAGRVLAQLARRRELIPLLLEHVHDSSNAPCSGPGLPASLECQ